MTERYIKNYRILGIAPGANWKELRKAYKSLVNTWHPDRFQQDARQKKLAEEKTKEITQSYKELAEYYKSFGILPIEVERLESTVAHAPTVPPSVSGEPFQYSNRGTTSPNETAAKTSQRRDSSFITRLIFSAALIGVGYFVWQLVPEKHLENNETPTGPTAETPNIQDHQGLDTVTTLSEKYITIGTPLGEVYAIQGVPTKTEKDIWYYGNSKVYFFKGAVSHWEESPDHPLRIKMTADDDKPILKFFSKGSSKEEVLAAQGSPDRDVGNVWDYGVSRVYFDKERVSGWHNSPLNPLKLGR